MNKELKLKIIAILGIVLLTVLVIIIAISLFSSDNENKSTDFVTFNDENPEFTLDDMMKMNDTPERSGGRSLFSSDENQPSSFLQSGEQPQNDYETEDEDIQRLQAALRGDNGKETNNNYSASPAPSKPYIHPLQSEPRQQTNTPVAKAEPQNIVKVEPEPEPEPVADEPKNRFYRGSKKQEKGNAIPCVIHRTITVTDGTEIKLRLLEDVISKEGATIPKNTIISAIAKFGDERINIQLQTVSIGKNIYTIEKKVYAGDGLLGLNMPENTKAEITKQAAASSIESADVDVSSDNVLNKTANAVTNVTKSVLAREKRKPEAVLKANHRLLLK